jgi:hypothetical protein
MFPRLYSELCRDVIRSKLIEIVAYLLARYACSIAYNVFPTHKFLLHSAIPTTYCEEILWGGCVYTVKKIHTSAGGPAGTPQLG